MLSTRKDSKKKKCCKNRGVTTPISAPAPSTSFSCSGDVCTRVSAPAPNAASALPQAMFSYKKDSSPPAISNSSFSVKQEHIDFLPLDILENMQKAAKNSFLPAFLSSLTEEFVTDYLKKRHYSSTQIYYINQTIRALTVLSLGAALSRTLASTGINIISKKCLSEKYSGYAAAATFVAYDFYFDPANMLKTSCAFTASIGSGIFASSTAKNAYNLSKQGIFSLKKTLEDKLSLSPKLI